MNPRSVLCEDGKPCLDFPTCHQNCECIRGLGRNVLLKDMSASQPNPTPQELTAPTLEQMAKDAARLDWLDKQGMIGISHAGYGDYRHYAGGGFPAIREVIDKAMAHE